MRVLLKESQIQLILKTISEQQVQQNQDVLDSTTQFKQRLAATPLPLGYDLNYNKNTELLQIALTALNKDALPAYGVDGKYGSETESAVLKFQKNKGLVNEAQAQAPQMPVIGRITSPFGMRERGMHEGIDIAVPSGTDIKCPADGTVIDSGFKNNNCGGTIIIQHANNITTSYCHCSQINVNKGEKVTKNDIIGKTGGDANDEGRGRATGPHLHFAIKNNGKFVDPQEFMRTNNFGDSYIPKVAGIIPGTVDKVTMENLLGELKQDLNLKDLDVLQKNNSTATKSFEYDEFFNRLMQMIGIEPTGEKITFFRAWRQAEGGRAQNNPLNTTYKLKNDRGMTLYNTAKVKNYSTEDYGLEATSKTLQLRPYRHLFNALLDNNTTAEQLANNPDLNTWGTGDGVKRILNKK